MSTTVLSGDASSGKQSDAFQQSLSRGMALLASMKLTCVLFLLGMFVVLVGSLAQARHDVWQVVNQYFRTYIAWIDVADFFPPSMFPSLVPFDWDSLGALRFLPFPGGWTIGWIMLANLLAAHSLRFTIRVKGGRRMAGIAILALGALATIAVVVTGNQQTGVEYAGALFTPLQIWYLMLAVMAVAAVVPVGVSVISSGMSKYERVLLAVVGVCLGGVLAYFLIGGEAARLNLSSMRILWQLLKGTACAVVMLIGCNLLFEKRGGIMLLHIGVALLMFSELQVGFYAKENMLSLKEGETSSFMRDTRARELAIVSRKGGMDSVVAIPDARLVAAAAYSDPADRTIDVESLPFLVRVDSFIRNSQLRPVLPGEEKTTTGLGAFATTVEIDPVTGMDDSQDMSAVKLTLLDRESGEEIDSLLCAQDVSEMRRLPIAEQITTDSRDYQFYLRFERSYKEYSVELLDVSRTNYVGSSTPRDYRSQIVIRDEESGDPEEFTLWMNNPLRYKGETFYQSGYNELPDGTEMTTLSVVRNTGWMLPYIACMIVAVGMFAQFGQTLGRYLSRFDRSKKSKNDDSGADTSHLPEGIRSAASGSGMLEEEADHKKKESSVWPVAVPVILVLVSAAWLMSKARPPKADPQAMNLYGFAQLPVAWKGRAQPVDSFARTELLMASHKSTFMGELSRAEIDHPENHDAVVELVEKYWPTAKTESLKDFSGEYSDWITEIMKLTSSGQDAVEERMRDSMVTRMPAVRWFLDIVARPDLAKRHRVIRIDNDKLLALLGLEQRAGLVYSVEEIQEHLKDLEKIRGEGQQLQMANQEHRMSQLQRKVVDLFQTVGRVDSLKNIFLTQESEGFVDAMVKAWWVLDRLGNSAAIMAVPTGSDNEQRSWETLIAAGALKNVRDEFAAAGVLNASEVAAYVTTTLPEKMVMTREALKERVSGSRAILESGVEVTEGESKAEAVKARAAASAERMNEPLLRFVLEVIGRADAEADIDQMLSTVTDDELLAVASAQVSSSLMQVFQELSQKGSDKRLEQIRLRLQAVMAKGEEAVTTKMNQELLQVVLEDLGKRAGGLIYKGGDGEVFSAATEFMITIMNAWAVGDVNRFNQGISQYQGYLAETPLPHVDAKVVSFEAFFNFFEPFMKAIYLYLPVLLMSFLSWIVWPTTLRRSAFWLMLLTFVLHTVALLMRMYISGRPPVTNLYSSAIFIGWAVVGASFAIEWLLRNGIGNILGSSVGMGTLVIAHYLARDEGDTLGVMQAVLDTTFWLATHVVCITLGYAATFLAGAMGLAYCVMSGFSNRAKSKDLDSLGKMIYGVLCFAVFFSLVGTVLGGLWADDSWGRFWGWDPKENGAMLIVMWNAFVLHARWDKMVRDYGTAVLAMFGNIVTAWSWFGVNELKAGLHTYGFTEGRLLALLVFIGIQTVIILVAMVPVFTRSSKTSAEPA